MLAFSFVFYFKYFCFCCILLLCGVRINLCIFSNNHPFPAAMVVDEILSLIPIICVSGRPRRDTRLKNQKYDTLGDARTNGGESAMCLSPVNENEGSSVFLSRWVLDGKERNHHGQGFVELWKKMGNVLIFLFCSLFSEIKSMNVFYFNDAGISIIL